jgi:hypothetical protein
VEDATAVVAEPDRQQLLDLFLNDAPARLDAAQQDVLDAQVNQEGAAAGGTATPEELAAMEADLLAVQERLADVQGEIDGLSELIAQLNDDQADALIRSLRNAVASGLVLPLDAAMLQSVIDGGYDKHQINALTQAFEQEARFMAKSDRAAAREAELGIAADADASAEMTKFEAKAASQKSKFMAKIDEPEEPDALLDDAVDDAVEEAAKEAARDTAKQLAKREARLLAKASVEDAVKMQGKGAARKASEELN